MTDYNLKIPVIPDVSQTDLGAPFTSDLWGVIPRISYAEYPSDADSWTCYDVQTDPSAAAVFEQAGALNLRRGGFHYLLQNKIQPQIDGFIAASTASGFLSSGKWLGELPPIADVEVDWTTIPPKTPIQPIQGSQWAAQVYAFLQGVQEAMGIKPIIYTGQSNGWPRVCSDGVPSWASQYNFWVKYYPTYPDNFPVYTEAMLPEGISIAQVLLWQYGMNGRSQGYNWNDLNVPTAYGMTMYPSSVVTPPVVVTPPAPVTDPIVQIINVHQSGKQDVYKVTQ